VFNKKKAAFTFIELTIFITIFAIILSSSLMIYDRIFTEQKISLTKQKMQKIKQAFASYYLVNKTLPCPAFIRADSENKYYLTQKLNNDSNDCFSESLQMDYYHGAVPVNNLGLTKDYLLDEWHNKISYILYKPIINFFNLDKKIKDMKKIECWIDLSYYQSLRLNKYFYLNRIIDKSRNNCDLSALNKNSEPYYYSDLLSNQGGVVINKNTNMKFAKNFNKVSYVIFLVLSDFNKSRNNNKKNLIIKNISFINQGGEIYLNQEFFFKLIPQKENIIVHDILFVSNQLSKQDQAVIQAYLGFKWGIESKAGALKVKSTTKSLLANNAILLLISHGKNSKGAFNSLGRQSSLYKILKLEKHNIYQLTTQEYFVKNNTLGSQNNFDDILTYMNYIELRTLSGS
jgi:type II secretory pathway pseudopilin PulG